MSVAPNWRDINLNRIPKRLKTLFPGARGSNAWFCFRTGTGPFRARGSRKWPTLHRNRQRMGLSPPRLSPCYLRGGHRNNPTGLARRRNMTMASRPLTMNPNYRRLFAGPRAYINSRRRQSDDSPEADAIRDATDGSLEALSEVERQPWPLPFRRPLLARRATHSRPPMNPQAQAKLQELIEAKEQGEWDGATDLLRTWRAYFDPALVAGLQGSIRLEAGDRRRLRCF